MDHREEIVELLLLVGHRARIAFEEACAFDEFTGCEVLLLRTLARMGPHKTGREVAKKLGWSAGRVSQVTRRLVAKGQLIRGEKLSITNRGLSEADQCRHLFMWLANELLAGLDEEQREMFTRRMRKIAENSEALPRIRRTAS